jgi:hypothetical protein
MLQMANHFTIRSPGWQYSLRVRSRHLVYFMFTPDGEILARDYSRYHHQPLWPQVFHFLSNLDILAGHPAVRLAKDTSGSDTSNDGASADGEGPAFDRFYVTCSLPNPGWEEIADEVLESLESEVRGVWAFKTALSLRQIVEDNLKSVHYLLEAVLSFSETHSAQAARQFLEAKSILQRK